MRPKYAILKNFESPGEIIHIHEIDVEFIPFETTVCKLFDSANTDTFSQDDKKFIKGIIQKTIEHYNFNYKNWKLLSNYPIFSFYFLLFFIANCAYFKESFNFKICEKCIEDIYSRT